jgi:hypothetical protein
MNETPGFGTRLSMAWRVIMDAAFAGQVAKALAAPAEKKALAPVTPATEASPAPALFLLSALQREGRFVDFLQQDVSSFADAEVGAAARVIHGGCRQALKQYFTFEPILPNPEGETITVATGFDPQRIQLTGNVAGQPPFKGSLKHHGWVASQVKLPAVSKTLDPRVIAPAEVELG